MSRVRHGTWTVWTNAGVLEAHALVTIVTLRTGTRVPALCAVTGNPLLAGVGIAQIQHHLTEDSRISHGTVASDRLSILLHTLSSVQAGGTITRTQADLAVFSRETRWAQASGS